MKKLFGFASIIAIFAVFACNNVNNGNNVKKPDNNKPGETERAPVIKKIEVLSLGGVSIFSKENPSNQIDAGTTTEDKVKVVITVDSGVDVTCTPSLAGTEENEFALTIVGKNSLKIKLSKAGKKSDYNLDIVRESTNTNTKTITSIKYFDGQAGNESDLTVSVARDANNIFEVERTEDQNFSFLPQPATNITKIQMNPWGSYVDVSKPASVYIITKRDAKKLENGLPIKVTFADGKTDEFTIKVGKAAPPSVAEIELKYLDGSLLKKLQNPPNKLDGITSHQDKIKVKIKKSDANATIETNPVLAGTEKDEWTLSNGENVLTIKVAKGTKTNTYTLKVEREEPVALPLKKIALLNVQDSSEVFKQENPTNTTIDAGSTALEKVKVKVEVDSDINVTYAPLLGSNDEWALQIGRNELTITLTKQTLNTTYKLVILREGATKGLESLKVATGQFTPISEAVSATKDSSDDSIYNVSFPYTKAGNKYSIFVKGVNTNDIVYIPGVTTQTPYPKADNSAIDLKDNLPAVGANATQEFYLFSKEEDISDLTKGKKYTLKLSVKAEPNTKITSITFNGQNGIINGKKITCATQFDLNTTITVAVTLEATTSSHRIVKKDTDEELNPITIVASGAEFRIFVIPQEGEDSKAVYNVKLDAKTVAEKIITHLKYLDAQAGSVDALTETADREEDIFKVEHTEDEPFSFLPQPADNISKVEMKTYNGYSPIPQVGGVYLIVKKFDSNKINQASGLTIKVTLADGKSDEFTIKKKA